jgi:hypothetical protein
MWIGPAGERFVPESGGSDRDRKQMPPPIEVAPDRVAAHDVFVSYASQDAAVANDVVGALERAGIICWIAPRDVIPGTFYADAIVHAIDASKAIVLVLSKHSVVSAHVLREVERGSSKRCPVVSLRTDQARMPAGLEYFLNTSQWLDASAGGTETALPKLVSAVRFAVQASTGTTLTAAPLSPTETPLPPARSSNRAAIAVACVVALAIAALAADRLWLSSHRPSPARKRTPYLLTQGKSSRAPKRTAWQRTLHSAMTGMKRSSGLIALTRIASQRSC